MPTVYKGNIVHSIIIFLMPPFGAFLGGLVYFLNFHLDFAGLSIRLIHVLIIILWLVMLESLLRAKNFSWFPLIIGMNLGIVVANIVNEGQFHVLHKSFFPIIITGVFASILIIPGIFRNYKANRSVPVIYLPNSHIWPILALYSVMLIRALNIITRYAISNEKRSLLIAGTEIHHLITGFFLSALVFIAIFNRFRINRSNYMGGYLLILLALIADQLSYILMIPLTDDTYFSAFSVAGAIVAGGYLTIRIYLRRRSYKMILRKVKARWNLLREDKIVFIPDGLRAWLLLLWPGFLLVSWIILLFFAQKKGVFFNIPEHIRGGILRSDIRAVPGFVQDPFYTLFQFIWIPFVWTVVCALRNIDRMVKHFITRSVTQPDEISFRSDLTPFLHKYQKGINYELQWLFAIGASLVAILHQIGTQIARIQDMDIMYWWDWRISKSIFIIRLIMVGMDIFLATIIVYRGAAGIIFTKKFLDLTELKPRPYHPDKAGGLGIVGKACLKFAWPMLVAGIGLALSYFTHEEKSYSIINSSVLVCLVLTTMFVFYFPLSSVHKKMKKFKKEWLDRLSLRMRLSLKTEEEDLDDNTNNALQDYDKLKILKENYEIVASIPVWPYNIKTISRFFSTILIPMLMFALKAIL